MMVTKSHVTKVIQDPFPSERPRHPLAICVETITRKGY
jgi:hypothetical protein